MMDEQTERIDPLRPRCWNPNCNKSFESLEEMVAVPGRGARGPRHFCEDCAPVDRRE